MKITREGLFSFAVATLVLAGLAAAEGPAPGISLTINTEQTKVKTGSRVDLRVVMENTTAHKLYVPVGGSFLGYTATVLDSAGAPPRLTFGYWNARGRREPREAVRIEPGDELNGLVGSTGDTELAPHERREHHLNMLDFYDIHEPGTYTIQVAHLDPESNTVMKSNTITITVTP